MFCVHRVNGLNESDKYNAYKFKISKNSAKAMCESHCQSSRVKKRFDCFVKWVKQMQCTSTYVNIAIALGTILMSVALSTSSHIYLAYVELFEAWFLRQEGNAFNMSLKYVITYSITY